MIYVARVLGAINYGEYTIALIPISIAMLVQDLGVSTSVTRFCATYRQQGNTDKLREIIWTGIIFTLVTSTLLSIIVFFASDFVTSIFLMKPELGYLLKVAAFAILGNGLYSIVQSVFIGYEKMQFRSLIQIVYSITRGVLAVVFIWAGMGTYGAVLSNTVGYLFVGFLGLILIYSFIEFKDKSGSVGFNSILRLLLGFGLPLYAGSLISSGLNQWYNSLMILNVATEQIGNYGAAMNFGVLISFLTVPIGTVLFPLFSKVERNDPLLRQLFNNAVKYTTLVTTPVVGLIILLSEPLIQIIYGQSYPYAAVYLSGYLLLYAFEGLGGTSLGYLIIGIGESRISLISSLATFLIGAPLSFLLIPRYQILGLIATALIAPRFGWAFNIYWMKKNLGFTIDWVNSAKIYGSTLVAFLASYLLLLFLKFDGWVELICGASIFCLIYILALPLAGIFNKNDLRELDNIVSVSGPLTPALRYLISIIRYFTK
jgi:O-antigen/teichoic acid export membrane protein